MRATIQSEHAAMLRRYVKSKRHTMQVDFDAFMAQLKRDIRARRPPRPPKRAIDCPCHPLALSSSIDKRRSTRCREAPTPT